MKLSVLCEDSPSVTESDILDWYALGVYADKDDDIKKEHGFLTDYIYDKLVGELYKAITKRVGWGPIPITASFTREGGMWDKLRSLYRSVSDATIYADKVAAIDSVVGMMHHGGPVAEHFPGMGKWFKGMADIKHLAKSPLEYWDRLSSRTKKLLYQWAPGEKTPRKVSELESLYLYLRKLFDNVHIKGNLIVGTVRSEKRKFAPEILEGDFGFEIKLDGGAKIYFPHADRTVVIDMPTEEITKTPFGFRSPIEQFHYLITTPIQYLGMATPDGDYMGVIQKGVKGRFR